MVEQILLRIEVFSCRMDMMTAFNDILEAARNYTSANMVDTVMAAVVTAAIALCLALFTLLRHRVPGKTMRDIQELKAALARQQAYHERYVLDLMKVDHSRGSIAS